MRPRLPTDHFLLPHERWMARRALAGSPYLATWSAAAKRENWGPEGLVLFAAVLASYFLGTLFGIGGVLLLGVSRTSGFLGLFGYLLGIAGIVLVLASAFRAPTPSELEVSTKVPVL